MYESQTLNAFIFDHCNKSMDNAVSAERYPLWKRACPGLNDIGFIRLGMLRCISLVDSGRHFLQHCQLSRSRNKKTSPLYNDLTWLNQPWNDCHAVLQALDD
ncbi:hypothetical protein [Bathymodiolus platifrons methanotrophic gill symbiont]|uniref:hypothetical protein n=1 Tax=Bathymodiolus platifrons methanotrophic gill symbiont TaxID=113268 RepID=UPI001124F6B2|nr:hypothetical protein [Bathymodiolus platifrons methanotrophic gill symbiont]